MTVLYNSRGVSDMKRMTPEAVQEKYGLSPAQYPEFAALRAEVCTVTADDFLDLADEHVARRVAADPAAHPDPESFEVACEVAPGVVP